MNCGIWIVTYGVWLDCLTLYQNQSSKKAMKTMIWRGCELIGLWEVSGIPKERRCLMSAFLMLTLVLLETSHFKPYSKWKSILKSPNTVKQQKPVEHLSLLLLQVAKQYLTMKPKYTSNGLLQFCQRNGVQITQKLSVTSELECKFASSDQSAYAFEDPELNGEEQDSWIMLLFH